MSGTSLSEPCTADGPQRGGSPERVRTALRALPWALAIALALLLPRAGAAAPDAPPSAHGQGAPDGPRRDDYRAELTLLLDAQQVRPGEPVRAGVLFELDPGWHIYWRNPGDSGLPTKLEWKLPGAQAGPLLWPAPEAFQEAQLTTYGYADQVLLGSDLSVPAGAPAGDLDVAVTADFLICKRQCIPGRVELHRPLRIGAERIAADRDTAALFQELGARLPVPAEQLGLDVEGLYSQSAIRPSDAFRAGIAVVPRGAGVSARAQGEGFAAFIPDVTPTLELTATGSRPHPAEARGFLVTLEGRAFADAPPELEQRLHGVLGVRLPDGVRWAEIDVPLPRAPAGAAVAARADDWLTPLAAAGTGLSLLRALLLALAGGLILNLMPCVLPVLAIKVVRVAELAHERRSAVWAQGGAYTAGIVTTMLAFAAVVVALRAAGTSVGWGFQFQEPRFIVAVSAVLVLFALNLFGAFEIDAQPGGGSQLLHSGSPLRRSFFEGLLAVVLATPCTAPFLGTAVGFAFAGSLLQIAGVFVAIGLGLAAPFVAVTLVPGWARFIPRAGAWTLHLRTGLGFALLATVVWMLAVLSAVAGALALVAVLAFLLGIAFLAWGFGLVQRGERPAWTRSAAALLLACAVGGVAVLPVDAPAGRASGGGEELAGEVPFARPAIAAELAAGRPVFVFFTADWCLTCKLNERFVLSSEPVRKEFERLGFATFKGDWTRRDEDIRSELERFGRAGVPMYLVYSPKDPASPRVLPELLTADALIAALRWAADGDVVASDRRS